jgi:hypothetical protein
MYLCGRGIYLNSFYASSIRTVLTVVCYSVFHFIIQNIVYTKNSIVACLNVLRIIYPPLFKMENRK